MFFFECVFCHSLAYSSPPLFTYKYGGHTIILVRVVVTMADVFPSIVLYSRLLFNSIVHSYSTAVVPSRWPVACASVTDGVGVRPRLWTEARVRLPSHPKHALTSMKPLYFTILLMATVGMLPRKNSAQLL